MKRITMKTGMLARELGYRDNNNYWTFYSKEYGTWFSTNTKGGISGKEKTFQQCTQTELQTWLRKKGIEVYVTPVYSNDEVIGYYPMVKWVNGNTFHTRKSYEKAMEDGLLLGLKYLISKKK